MTGSKISWRSPMMIAATGVAIAATSLLYSPGTPAMANREEARSRAPPISERLASAGDRLRRIDPQHTGPEAAVQQWYNWGNYFANWSNWANWNNWGNFNNWLNR